MTVLKAMANRWVALAFATCLFCFTAQCWNHMKTFFSKETTLSISYKRDPLHFPSVTVCAENGIRRDILTNEFHLPESYWDTFTTNVKDHNEWFPPKSKEQAEHWWLKSTFDQSDLIANVDLLGGNGGNISLEEVRSSSYGRCYTINARSLVDKLEIHLRVSLKFPYNVKRLKAYLNEKEHGPILLSTAFPVDAFKEYFVEPEKILGVALAKKVNLVGESVKYRCHVNHFQCLEEAIKEAIPCYTPTSASYGQGKELCHDLNDTFQASNLFAIMGQQYGTGKCGQVCELHSYGYLDTVLPLYGQGNQSAELFLRFLTLFTEETKETSLYNFNSILSEVGGSLGLFLGFSVFGAFSSHLAPKLETIIK